MAHNSRPAAEPAELALSVDCVVDDERWLAVDGVEAAIEAAARAAYSSAGTVGGSANVAVALVDDDAMRALNRQFRGIDKPTNVLSFPAANPAGPDRVAFLGDLALAYETVLREGAEQGVTILDHVRHLTVHGVLHLLGHDHETEADAVAMEALETRILAGLDVSNPYAP